MVMAKALSTSELRQQKMNREDFKKIERNKIILFLDRLLNNHNLGAILRVADAGLVEKVLICDPVARTDGKKAISSAMGVADWVPHEKVSEGLHILKDLQNEGYKLWALELCDDSVLYYEAALPDKVVLIVGSEMKGVSEEILRISDQRVHIPMAGMANSLNVATATSIALFDILRRKHQAKPQST